MEALRKYLWIVVGGFALGLLGMGAFLVYAGFDTKAMIREEMAQENVITAKDAEQFGIAAGLPVLDAKTAQAESDVIEMHSTNIKGEVLKSGTPTTLYYAEMKKDLFVDDQAYTNARTSYLNGLNLRNALSLAIMGFGVANLAMAVGAIAIVMGVAFTGLTAAAFVWALKAHPKAAPAARPELRPTPARA